jgi:predicted lactoylglutathione lyase
MLFAEDTFRVFTGSEITDTAQSTEVLLSVDAESKEEVDEMARKVAGAGGVIFGEPGGEDWMYGFGFSDLDGHRWNVLYMDMSKR